MCSWLTLEPALTLFTPRGSVYEIAMHGFPIYAVSFLLMGTKFFASSLFTALSDGLVSAIISFSRTLVFLVAMLLFLPLILRETGIWLAVPVAEALGVMVSVFFFSSRDGKSISIKGKSAVEEQHSFVIYRWNITNCI